MRSLYVQSIVRTYVAIFGSSISRHICIVGILGRRAFLAMKCTKTNIGVRMRRGRVAFKYAQMLAGEKAMSHAVLRGHKLELPRTFWASCLQHCCNRVSTDASRKSLRKALNLYISSLRMGATTNCGRTTAEQKSGSAEIGWWRLQ